MSASARLSKLKNSPIIRDVDSRLNQSTIPTRMQQMQQQQMQQQRQMSQGDNENNSNSQQRNMVQPMTILTWHEQRLNKIDEVVKNLQSEKDNNEVVISLIETIEALEKKINFLSQAYDSLSNSTNSNKKSKSRVSLKDEVKKELNKVKLTVSEK